MENWLLMSRVQGFISYSTLARNVGLVLPDLNFQRRKSRFSWRIHFKVWVKLKRTQKQTKYAVPNTAGIWICP